MVSIITTIIGLSVAGFIVLLMRKDRLHISHGMGWIFVAITFALLGFAPGIIDYVAGYLGVDYPPVLALTLGIALLIVKILVMDIERSRIEMRNQRVVQRIAMLEADLRKLTNSTPEEDAIATRDTSCKEPESENLSGNSLR